MANRHFAKFGDVWKHLPLVEILATERPDRYWESHAGSALYRMVDDGERRYGASRFGREASRFPALASSRYLHHLGSLNDTPRHITRYPGSPMLAMLELGASCSYLFCDLDTASVADLQDAGARLGLHARLDVRERDGTVALSRALPSASPGETVIVHVDPYDPWLAAPGGTSALDLAAALIDAGVGLVYWYGFDRPGDRAWAFHELSRRAPAGTLWCGDMLVTSETGAGHGGHLGSATTPGTGCGLVCANVSRQAVEAAGRLGQDMAAAYDGVPLPGGTPGHLDFAVAVSAGEGGRDGHGCS